jgi:hypothetical protein
LCNGFSYVFQKSYRISSRRQAMSLFWAMSSIYGLAVHLALHLPRVRRLVGIPYVPGESATPMRAMAAALKTRSRAFWDEVREKNALK